MRILITGSRTWPPEHAELILNRLIHFGRQAEDHPITVIHGGAKGVDTWAGDYAASLGYEVEVYPADWEQHGKKAGFIRNSEMVAKGADVCLAFIHQHSRGATMCAALASKAGIETFTWHVE